MTRLTGNYVDKRNGLVYTEVVCKDNDVCWFEEVATDTGSGDEPNEEQGE